jgi:hypothetical protein
MERPLIAVLVMSFLGVALVAYWTRARRVFALPLPSYPLNSSRQEVSNKSRVIPPSRTVSASSVAKQTLRQNAARVPEHRHPMTVSTSRAVIIGPGVSEIVMVQPKPPTLVSPARAVQITPVAPAVVVRVSAPPPFVIQPSPAANVTIHPTRAISIQPPQRGAWDERGWTRRTNQGQDIYEGSYQVMERRSGRQRSFDGRIAVNQGHITAYISDPPAEIKKHRHGPCFQLHRVPWFQLHWNRPAQNPDDAILYMERVLDESLN